MSKEPFVIEAVYPYESTNARGHSVIVRPGERYYVINDSNEDWWLVSKNEQWDDNFYFPRTYGKTLDEASANEHVLSMSIDTALSFNDTNSGSNENRLSTFGSKRRSYQLATRGNEPGLESEAGKSNTLAVANGSGLMRRRSGPGFKLAAPDRISRSIPVDLNFVHGVPTDIDGASESVVLVSQPATVQSEQQQGRCQTAERSNGKSESESDSIIIAETSKVEEDQPGQAGPIYANVKPVTIKQLPPLPVAGNSPIRHLNDGWAEYVDENNRRYFYNPVTRKATWKPPRTTSIVVNKKESSSIHSMSSGDELDSSFISEDGDGLSNFASGTSGLTSSVIANSQGVEYAVPCEVASSTHAHSTPCNSRQDSTMPRRMPSVYNPIYDCGNYQADGISLGTNSIAKSGAPDGDQPTVDYLKSLADLDRSNVASQQPQLQNFIRYGVLNRCKYMEAGKRIKKQWLPCFAYLTNAHMIFYKDEKSAEKKGNQYSTPLGVCDLRGAKLRWLDGDVSRRKNVFQLELVDGTVYLFHAENQSCISSWYDDLRQVIALLPMPEFYPAPTIEGGAMRLSARKTQSTGPPPAVSASPIQGKKGVSITQKDRDKRKSDIVSVVIPKSESEAGEHLLQKQTILEKLRRFFRTRPSMETLKERGIYKLEPVFGSSLTDICRREKSTIPKFIVICAALIEEKGLNVDGLYRINGNLSQVQRIRCQVDQDKYTSLLSETDVHVLTGALKLFFRELQEPAFPTVSTKDFLNAIKLQNSKQRFKAFSELIPKLPSPHHDTLDHLFRHLLQVAQHASKNRMQIHNLAIVFGPTLFSSNASTAAASSRKRKPDDKRKASDKQKDSESEKQTMADVAQSNSQLAYTMILQGQIVEYLLKEHSKLFKSVVAAAE